MHYFCDASECGYEQATYLRMMNNLEKVHCSLIFNKSRVAAVKYVSIPRLKLTAATLSVKISKMLWEELDIHISYEVFWTNSQVVLGYINNDSSRFKFFVANHVCSSFKTTQTLSNGTTSQLMITLKMMHP